MEKKRFVLALMVIFVVFILTVSAEIRFSNADEKVIVEKPIWNIGDTWTYKMVRSKSGEKNEIIQKRIFMKEEDGMYVVSAAQGKINTYYDAAKLNVKYVKDASGKITDRFIPEKPTFNWPLKVGKWWTARYSWQSPLAGPDTPPYVDVTVKVVGWEPIIVMGKEIMTFKLVEQRYNPRGICVSELTQWFSPEIRNVVKWVDDRQPINWYETGELINFFLADAH